MRQKQQETQAVLHLLEGLRRLLLYPPELRGQDLISSERLVPTKSVGILKITTTHRNRSCLPKCLRHAGRRG
jgi:hypothetical protein